VAPRLGDVHDDAGHELGRIEGLGIVAGRLGTAVVACFRPIVHHALPTPLDPLADSGHFVTEEKPDEVARLLRDWLSTREPPSGVTP
jgi:pimeloyl-ACP methyl ester carboxylesterase